MWHNGATCLCRGFLKTQTFQRLQLRVAQGAHTTRKRYKYSVKHPFSSNDNAVSYHAAITPPYSIPTTEDLQRNIHASIKEDLVWEATALNLCSHEYFDGKGKLLRPRVVILMGRACRASLCLDIADEPDIHWPDDIERHQNTIARITEMIHTASLVHDDVIDEATSRRGKTSVNKIFTEKECVLAGDAILARATYLLADIGNTRVIECFAQVIEDLVRGEVMQLGLAQDAEQRFSNYIKKSEAKTASLLSRSCKTVAILAEAGNAIEDAAYGYGRHLGIGFQLIDDVLDIVQSSSEMGKETSVDLKLGLATAPVLFASEEFPELLPMMMRKFQEDGDVEAAHAMIVQSSGIERTRNLAAEHAHNVPVAAIKCAQELQQEVYVEELTAIATKLLTRTK